MRAASRAFSCARPEKSPPIMKKIVAKFWVRTTHTDSINMSVFTSVKSRSTMRIGFSFILQPACADSPPLLLAETKKKTSPVPKASDLERPSDQ